MKNIRNSLIFWHLLSVNLFLYQIQTREVLEEFRFELAILLGFDVFGIELHLLLWGVIPRLKLFVMKLFLKLLYMFEIFSIGKC